MLDSALKKAIPIPCHQAFRQAQVENLVAASYINYVDNNSVLKTSDILLVLDLVKF